MVTRQFWNVRTAPVDLLHRDEAMREVERCSGASRHRIISDRCAQTIASWWHSPQSPYSTRLSTGGHVDRYATIDDFLSPEQWDGEEPGDVLALRRLRDYLRHWQAQAPAILRSCACYDCLDLVMGKVGELCEACENEGCDAQFTYSCERGEMWQEDDPSADCPDDCTCLYCIPGA